MKVVENSLQNARYCTIFKNFLGGACPQTPLAKARSFAARDMPLRGMYIQTPRNFKVGPPPLRNPAYVPASVHVQCLNNKYRAQVLYKLIVIYFIIYFYFRQQGKL